VVALLADVRTLSPWWERWPGWWTDQQKQVRRRWGKGTGFTLESAGHHATWTGEIRLHDGSREAAQIIWGPATPFFAPRIVFPGCLSAVHQLNDGSACLLSPVDPENGWEGVIDIDYWMERAEEWVAKFRAEAWAVPAETWALYRLLLPGYRYRRAMKATRIVALPPGWRDADEGFGRVRVRVPTAEGIAAVVAWEDRLGRSQRWEAGEALVPSGFDEVDGTWARFSYSQGVMKFKLAAVQRRFDRLLRDQWTNAAQQGRDRAALFSIRDAGQDVAAGWTFLRFAAPGIAEGGDAVMQLIAMIGMPKTPGIGVPLHADTLDARRRAGRSAEMHDAIRNTQVILAGLGSLGSEVAHLLAQEGFRHFFLVDGDIFLPGNESRHRAGLVHAGRSKVDVVADLIRQVQPEAEVQTHMGWFDEMAPTLLGAGDGQSSLFIGVTGDEATEHFLGDVAEYFNEPCVHGWLEAGGRLLRVTRFLPLRDPTISAVLRSGAAPTVATGVEASGPRICADTVLPGSAMAIHAAANFLVRQCIDIIAGRVGDVNHWLFTPGGLDGVDVPLALRSPYGVLGVTLLR
jgi:hypothetical protein